MRARLILLASLFLFFSIWSGLGAQSIAVELHNGTPVLARGGGLSWFAETEGPLDIGRVLGGQEDARFQPAVDGLVPMHFGTVWIRLVLRNLSNEAIDWALLLDQWSLKSIKLYRPSAGRDWVVSQAGTAEPAVLRELGGRAWQFRLDPRSNWLLRGRTATIYLQVTAPLSAVRLPVMVGETRQLSEFQFRDNLVISWIAGAYSLVLMVALALFLGSIERLYAVLTVLAGLALAQYLVSSGLGPIMLTGLASSDFLLTHSPDLMSLYLGFSLVLLMLFLRSQSILPRTYMVIRILTILLLVLALVEIFVPDDLVISLKLPALLVSMGIVTIVRIVVPLLALRQGKTAALLYLIAFGLEMVGSTLYLFQMIGRLPNEGLLRYGPVLGGVCQFLVLFYASSIRIRQLQHELAMANHGLQDANIELEHRVRIQGDSLREERGKLARQSMEDELTGLGSRRFILDRLHEEFHRFKRHNTMVSILCVDLDNFKLVNESWGRQVGDEVLKAVSILFADSLRGSDRIGRLGDEEFLILLPDTSLAQAKSVSEKIHDELAGSCFTGTADRCFSVSCSIGLSQAQAGYANWQEFLQTAESALNRAKLAGRNRTEVWQG